MKINGLPATEPQARRGIPATTPGARQGIPAMNLHQPMAVEKLRQELEEVRLKKAVFVSRGEEILHRAKTVARRTRKRLRQLWTPKKKNDPKA
jgi:hypothetical protein